VKLIPFLESIGIYQPQDVRPVLEAYRGKDIPVEYAKTEAAMKAAHVEEHLAKRGQGGLASSLTLTGLFSSGPSGSGSSSGPYVPPMYLEVKRAEAQELYKREREYIEEHKAEFDRLLEEDRKAAMGETPANMMGYIQAISGAPPPPAAGAEGQAQAQGET
jgi:import inner membrane translocase subunit TIM50